MEIHNTWVKSTILIEGDWSNRTIGIAYGGGQEERNELVTFRREIKFKYSGFRGGRRPIGVDLGVVGHPFTKVNDDVKVNGSRGGDIATRKRPFMEFNHRIFVINVSKSNKFAVYKKSMILIENSATDRFGSIGFKKLLFIVGSGTEIGQNSLSFLFPTGSDLGRTREELKEIVLSIINTRISIRAIFPILNVGVSNMEKCGGVVSFVSASGFTEFLHEGTRSHNGR
jgi:hypothetical protein